MVPLRSTVPEAVSRQVHILLGIAQLTDFITHQSPWRVDDPTHVARITSRRL